MFFTKDLLSFGVSSEQAQSEAAVNPGTFSKQFATGSDNKESASRMQADAGKVKARTTEVETAEATSRPVENFDVKNSVIEKWER